MAQWDSLGVTMVCTGVTGLCILGALTFAPYIRTYLGAPSSDDLYNLCMDGIHPESRGAKDPAARALFSGYSSGVCSAIKGICDQNPSGAECRRISHVAIDLVRS